MAHCNFVSQDLTQPLRLYVTLCVCVHVCVCVVEKGKLSQSITKHLICVYLTKYMSSLKLQSSFASAAPYAKLQWMTEKPAEDLCWLDLLKSLTRNNGQQVSLSRCLWAFMENSILSLYVSTDAKNSILEDWHITYVSSQWRSYSSENF